MCYFAITRLCWSKRWFLCGGGDGALAFLLHSQHNAYSYRMDEMCEIARNVHEMEENKKNKKKKNRHTFHTFLGQLTANKLKRIPHCLMLDRVPWLVIFIGNVCLRRYFCLLN